MNKANRKAVIAGNWKMNLNRMEAASLLKALAEQLPTKPCLEQQHSQVVVCVPYTNLETALEVSANTSIAIGAQNCHFAPSGAFTGEISASMLCELGVSHVIVGHSERRQYFAETDQTVNQRTKAAIEAGLVAIVCVGELLTQREKGVTEEIVRLQTKIALQNICEKQLDQVMIAYEPVWAIGTGKTATAEQAGEVCAMIRKAVAECYSPSAAEKITILYGGSMNAQNADELLAQPHVDGGLIGGASLKAEDFTCIVNAMCAV